jgi:SAM-dependent methyltransferase
MGGSPTAGVGPAGASGVNGHPHGTDAPGSQVRAEVSGEGGLEPIAGWQDVLVVDAQFGMPRLAEIYDALDLDRSDLDVYAAMVDEFGASSVLDIGCGTGTLACMLARRGIAVVGVDPASASLDVARRKSGADAVRWLIGDAMTLPPLDVDLVTMTGNVAQVFVPDREWQTALAAARTALRPEGRLVVETRDPEQRAWRGWTREQTYRQVDVPGVGGVENWVELTDVALPLVSFRAHFVFASDGAVLTSDSTLRFRDRQEVVESLVTAGFAIEDIRGAPDRPGREMVFVAAARSPASTA